MILLIIFSIIAAFAAVYFQITSATHSTSAEAKRTVALFSTVGIASVILAAATVIVFFLQKNSIADPASRVTAESDFLLTLKVCGFLSGIFLLILSVSSLLSPRFYMIRGILSPMLAIIVFMVAFAMSEVSTGGKLCQICILLLGASLGGILTFSHALDMYFLLCRFSNDEAFRLERVFKSAARKDSRKRRKDAKNKRKSIKNSSKRS